MPASPNKLSQFWQELKRRKVVRVITVYAAAAFVILELVDIVSPSLRLPEWTMNFILVLLIVGFIIAVILSWIYDIHPEGGIVKTEPAHRVKTEAKPKSSNGWRIATYVSLVVIIGLLALHIFGNRDQVKFDESLKKSIAVLPFYYYNMDPGADDIGDAFANEIITQLYKIKGFDRIISHTSTLQYKGPNKPSMPMIGIELGANYIIEGSLERQNENVSIQIQIIYAAGDDHIWAEEFKGKWDDIFTIRANIAKSVAEELRTILTLDEIVQIEEKATDDLKAYDYYLLGNQYRSKLTEEAFFKAIDLYESALDLDPEFALAYVGLGKSYRSLFVRANWLPDEAFEQARNAASMALDINDKLAEAHELLAQIKYEYDWDLKAAERELMKALELNPNLAYSYSILGDILLLYGRYDESHQCLIQAVQLDPNSSTAHGFLGLTYYLVGQVDSAITYLQNRIDIDSNLVSPHFWLGIVYLEIGEYSKAIRELEKVISMDSVPQHFHMFLGIAYAKAGMLEETRRELEVIETLEKESTTVSFARATLLAELGEFDSAIYWLQKSYEERSQWVFYIKPFKVLFSTMRSNPRFIEIYNRVWSNN